MASPSTYRDPTFEQAMRNLRKWERDKQARKKAAAILADHDGRDSETQRSSKERIMTTIPIIRAIDWSGHVVTNPSGRTIRPKDLDMQTLCNGDQHTVGGSLNRAEHLITAVK